MNYKELVQLFERIKRKIFLDKTQKMIHKKKPFFLKISIKNLHYILY